MKNDDDEEEKRMRRIKNVYKQTSRNNQKRHFYQAIFAFHLQGMRFTCAAASKRKRKRKRRAKKSALKFMSKKKMTLFGGSLRMGKKERKIFIYK